MKTNEIRLGEQCVVTSSKRFHLSERITQGVPFYCSKEIIKKFNGEDVTECDYISEDLYKKCQMNLGYQKKMIYLLQREEQLEFHTYIKERIGFILRMEI